MAAIDERPERTETWQRLRKAIGPHRWTLVLGGLLSLVTGATGLALPLVVRELVDGLGEGVSIRIWLILLSLLVVANAAVGAVGGYVLERTGESVVLSVRKGLVSHLLRLRMSVADDAEPGDLMSRVTGDTTQLRAMATQTLVSTVTATITLVATIALMGVVDLPMLGVTLVVLVIAAVVVGVIVPRINRASKVVQESVGAMGAELERMFGAFRTVKASGAEGREETALHGAADEAWRAGVRAAKWSALAGNVAGLAIQAAFLAVLTFGGARVASGAIEVGTLIAFLLYVYYLMPPIGELTGAATQYQVGAAAISRIVEAESLPVEIVSTQGAVGRSTHPMSVEFDRVTFGYRKGGPPAHVEVSFVVPPGGVTALVGPSGAGKTTVFSLVERFYRPDSGVVRVDGRDVEDWDLAELRAAIGYVEQDAPVLSGTLRENLMFAAPDVPEADVFEVVATTRLSPLVDSLPDRLDTRVGHRGMRLSGGERQRVAIARAMLRRPRLLLLDEATSQLDAVNEAALRDTVSEIASATTVLVVAHRLSTVTLADRIMVFDRGTVRSIGTHGELLEQDDLYAELAATQLLTADDGI